MPADLGVASVPTDIDAALRSEMTQRAPLPWARLPKWEKVKALGVFTQAYADANSLDENATGSLSTYLRKALDGRRLQCGKDVVYDKVDCVITAIPGLGRSPGSGRFTLRSGGAESSSPRSQKCA